MDVIDISFRISGTAVPRDHGYALYSAICRVVPTVHGARWLGVHPLAGTPADENTLVLRPRTGLCLRLSAARIVEVLPLAGRTLDVHAHRLQVGVPTVHALEPAESLDARLLAIKLTTAPRRHHPELHRSTLDVQAFAQRYEAEISRQLRALDINRPFRLCGRQSLKVGERRIVGYSVRVDALTAEESLRLQANGLGGKRAMGCGIFRPTLRHSPDG